MMPFRNRHHPDLDMCEGAIHDSDSLLALTHTLLELRRDQPALTIGAYQSLEQENSSCFVYLRRYQDQCYLVVLNFSAQDQVVKLLGQGQGNIALSTCMDREGSLDLTAVHLRGNEGLLVEIGPPSS
jgi:alpha-glucosidase